jgi:hypothetical protein
MTVTSSRCPGALMRSTQKPLFVEERDPLNHAGQLGGGGASVWGGGIHLD